jgi:hypothetical protein
MTKKHRKKTKRQQKQRAGEALAVLKAQGRGIIDGNDTSEPSDAISPQFTSYLGHEAVEQASVGHEIPQPRGAGSPPKGDTWPEEIKVAILSLASNAWRAKIKMVDSESGEPREEMRRVFRHIEGMFNTFGELGLHITDHQARDPYDSGMPVTVIGWEETPGLSREEIVQTIKPSITRQGQILQWGEVIVGTPVEANATDTEGNR